METGATDSLAFNCASIGIKTTNHGPNKNRVISIKHCIALGWLLLIYLLSSLSCIANINAPFAHFDKLAHLGEYGILCLLLYWNFINMPKSFLGRHPILFSVLFTILYGLSDEFHQIYVPMRTADLADVLADSAGAGLAHLCLLFVKSFDQLFSFKTLGNTFSFLKAPLSP